MYVQVQLNFIIVWQNAHVHTQLLITVHTDHLLQSQKECKCKQPTWCEVQLAAQLYMYKQDEL